MFFYFDKHTLYLYDAERPKEVPMSHIRLFSGALDCIHLAVFSQNNPGIALKVTKRLMCTMGGERVAASYHTEEDCFYLCEPHLEEVIGAMATPDLKQALVISIALHESRHRAQVHGLVKQTLHPDYYLPKDIAAGVWKRARVGISSAVPYELDAYTLQLMFHQVVRHGRKRSTPELVRLAAHMAALSTQELTQKFKPYMPA